MQNKDNKLLNHIETLQKKVDKLTEENTLLKRENAALVERVQLCNSAIKEAEANIKEARRLQEELKDTIREAQELKIKYRKEFEEQLKRIKRQK